MWYLILQSPGSSGPVTPGPTPAPAPASQEQRKGRQFMKVVYVVLESQYQSAAS